MITNLIFIITEFVLDNARKLKKSLVTSPIYEVSLVIVTTQLIVPNFSQSSFPPSLIRFKYSSSSNCYKNQQALIPLSHIKQVYFSYTLKKQLFLKNVEVKYICIILSTHTLLYLCMKDVIWKKIND